MALTSAVVPTSAMRSPETAMASADGLAPSPVHTVALTMASVTGGAGGRCDIAARRAAGQEARGREDEG